MRIQVVERSIGHERGRSSGDDVDASAGPGRGVGARRIPPGACLAEVALAADDAPEVHDCLSRAQRIVSELTVTLDHDRGGALATDLARLYGFVTEQLIAANVAKDAAALTPATRVLTELRDAWDTACVRGAVPVAG